MTAAAAQDREIEKGGARGQTILVLDFGSQFSQLIARRVREANVYCELVPGTTPWSELKKRDPAGLILGGGPASVYEPGAPQVDPEALRAGIPVLGICYGMQLIAHHLGGKVDPAEVGRGQAHEVDRVQHAQSQLDMDIALEEAVVERVETGLPEEAVVGGGEGTAGHGGNAVHLVEQTLVDTLPGNPQIAQFLQ